jgi:hypothetical protein
LSSREVVGVKGHLKVREPGKTIEQDFATNDDGVAELALPVKGYSMDMEIRADDGELLASGAVRFEDIHWDNTPKIDWLKPTRSSGPLTIHVAPWGGRLTSGFPGMLTVWVEGAPSGELEIEAEGEESATVDHKPARVCPSNMAALAITPLLQAAGVTIRARSKSGAKSEWFGALPITVGGMQLGSVDIDDKTSVTAPGNAKTAYVEIDDDRGRAWSSVLELAGDATEPRPHAMLAMPKIPSGDYWIVVSPDPRGAETLASGTMARRAHVAKEALDPCESVSRLAASATGFPRWVALDGLSGRRAALAQRRRHGRMIALSGLASGGLLEFLLIVRAWRTARRQLQTSPGMRLGYLDVAIALMMTMLGFAVLAAMVAWLGN